jgi:hypothetical protein
MSTQERTELSEKLDQVITLLSGSDLDKNDEGLIGKVRVLSIRVKKLERFKDRGLYLIIGAAITGGYQLRELIVKFL